jgi:hypothetical protein
MCLIKRQDMKVYCRVEIELHLFLVMALGVGEWLASRQASFIPEVRTSGTQWIGGLDALEKMKTS